MADAVVFCSSGLGDLGRHDTEIICFPTGGNEDFLRTIVNIDTARFFRRPTQTRGERRGKRDPEGAGGRNTSCGAVPQAWYERCDVLHVEEQVRRARDQRGEAAERFGSGERSNGSPGAAGWCRSALPPVPCFAPQSAVCRACGSCRAAGLQPTGARLFQRSDQDRDGRIVRVSGYVWSLIELTWPRRIYVSLPRTR